MCPRVRMRSPLRSRIEDLSQRSAKEQVFANPDGSWTSETSTAVRFAEKDGTLVPIEEAGTLESAGTTVTGAGTELSTSTTIPSFRSSDERDLPLVDLSAGNSELDCTS